MVVTIHGGMLRDDRRKVETSFKQDKDVRILIATDAAGEGINLQRAHLMVNYDLPWNPKRLEQRFGRIHRIGQTEVCYLWNLMSQETREGQVFQRLFQKIEEEKAALSGRVFDILGKVTFDNKPLRELLVEAIRYGNDPVARAKMQQVVDRSLDRKKLLDLLKEEALTDDVMDDSPTKSLFRPPDSNFKYLFRKNDHQRRAFGICDDSETLLIFNRNVRIFILQLFPCQLHKPDRAV